MALKNLNQMSTLGGGGTILNSSTNRGSEFLLRQEEEKKKAEEKRRAQIRALDELEAEAGFRNLSQNKNAPVSDNFGTVGQNKLLSAVGRNNLGISGKVINNSVATTSPKPTLKEIKREESRENWNNFGRSVTGLAKRAGNEIVAGFAEIGDTLMAGEVEYTENGGMKLAPVGTQANGRTAKEIKADAQADYDKRKRDYLTSGKTLTDAAEREIEAVKKEYEDVLGSGFGKLASDTVGSTARQLPRLVISAIPGFGGAAATTTMFATSSNSAYKEALLNGATDEEAKMYSILAGAVEAGGEYAIGGILGQGTGYLDDLLKISKNITNPIARTAANIFGSSVGEGFEEMAQSVLTTIAQKITYDPDAKVDFTELAYEGLIGALSAGLMSGVNIRGQYRGAKNEIGQIQAEKALGTMSSEDILSAIDSVHKTAVELGQEEQFNSALLSVYEKAYGDKASFTERLKNNAKKILDPETEAKANSLGILSTADLSEDAKIAVAKAAAKYGIGTAGTRVSGMEVGADAGSIGEAERLSKLTGSRVEFFDEGVTAAGTVNGYVDVDGILHVNRQAKNPLAVVLSHELTHALEGSSSYDDLSYIVFKTLRESGSDIGQMIDDIMTLYAKHNVSLTEEDARREIVADYVSENFMGSEEQIRNIVAEDRPLAVRIREFLDRVLARFGNTDAQGRVQEYDRVREIRDAYKRALGERVDTSTVPEARYSISYTIDNHPVAVVDNDILSSIDTTTWTKEKKKQAQAAAKQAMLKFEDGVTVDGIRYKVNHDSRRHYAKGNNTDKLYRTDKKAFADKMRASDNTNDIISATTSWRVDGYLEHERDDNLVDFIHGTVLIQSGDNKYEANTVIGITERGEYVFYDIDDMVPTDFETKKKESSSTASDVSDLGDMLEDSFGGSISKTEPVVNNKFSVSPAEDGEIEVRDEDVLYERGMTDEDVAAEMEAAERRRQLGSAERQMNAAVISGNPRLQNYYRLADLADRQRSNPLENVDESFVSGLNEEQRGRLEDAVNRANYEYDRAAQDYNDAVHASLEGQFVSAETAQKITDSLLEAEAQWQERDPLESLDEDIVNALGADKATMFADQLRENNRKRTAEAAEWRAQAPIISDTTSADEYAWNNLGQLQEMADWQQSDVRRNVTREEVEIANREAEESLQRTLEEDRQRYEAERNSSVDELAAIGNLNDATNITPYSRLKAKRAEAPAITEEEYETRSENVKKDLYEIRNYIVNTMMKEASDHGIQFSGRVNGVNASKEAADAMMDKILQSYFVSGEINTDEVNDLVKQFMSEQGNGSSDRDASRASNTVLRMLVKNADKLNRHATIVRENADAKKAEESGEAVRSFDDVEAKEYIEKWKEYGRAKRRLDSLERKRVMTNAERITYQKLKTGQISPDSLTGAGSEVLLEMYEAYKAAEDLKREVNSYSNALKKARREKAIKLLGDISKWKDGTPFGQHIKTMERNIRKSAPDSKTAREMIKEYIQPVYNANAAATRYKNEIRKKIKDLNIKTKPNKEDKISESYAIQFIGEALDAVQRISESQERIEMVAGHTLEEWHAAIVQIRNENPGIDFDKVNRDIEAIRSIYDEMIEKMNIAYVKAGYAPIDYRKGYFPHFQEEKGDGLLAKFTKEIGLTPDYVAALPTEINGQTHKFRPGVKYNRHKLSRGQGNTIAVVYDAVKGMDMYLETAASVIHMTDAIQNLRALEQGIKYATSKEGIRAQIDEIQNDVEKSAEEKENAIEALKADGQYRLSNFANNLTDYTNKIAGKQSAADRGVEYLFGRDAMNLTNALKGRYGAAAVGANIASAITNTIPLVQATANTSYTKLARGIWDAVVSNDGFADRSAFLVNRRGSDMLSLTGKEKFASGTMALMSMADNVVSEAIVRAKYYEFTQNGMTEADAMEAADDYARGLMAGRSTGEMPTVFNSKNPVLGLFTQFQLEVNNQFQWMFMDLPRERREEAGKSLVAAFLRLFIGSWLYNELIETITGRRSAFDPINMVNETVGDVSGYELPNTFHALSDLASGRDVDFTTDQANNVWDFVTKSFERTASELPFVGSWLGGGRIPVGNILETVPNLVEAGAGLVGDSAPEYKLQKLGDAALEIGQYFLPGAGGQIRKSIQGIDAAIRGGRYRYTTEGEEYLQYPTSGGFDSYVQGALFGRSSFRGAQEWADDNYASLSVDATATYDQLVELGHDYLDVYDLVSKISRAKKTDTQSAASVKLDMIDTAKGYTDEEKAILYYGLVASDDEREKIKEMMDAGVSGESIYYASAVFRDINSTGYGEDKTDDEKYSELRSYVKSNEIDMSVLDLEDGERYSTSDVKRVYLDDTKISDEEKAYIYRYLLAGEKESEVFDECLERGDDAGEIYDYLYKIYTSKSQAEKLEALGSSKISDESKYDIYYFDYALDDEIEALDELKNSAPLGEIVETMTELRRLKKSEEKRDSLSSSPLSIYEQSVYYFSAMASKSQLEKLDGLLDGGISQVEYYDFLINTLDLEGKNKKEQVMQYINGTGLSSKEKDLLYLAAGYSENTIDDAPWHSGSFGGSGIFGTSSIFGDSGIFGNNNSIFGDSGIFGEKGIFG